MAMKSVDDLFAYRDRIDKYIQDKEKFSDKDRDIYEARWGIIADELLDISSCVLSWAVVKVNFGEGNILQIEFDGASDGGCYLSLHPTQKLFLNGNTIQYVENSPLYKNKQITIYCDDEGNKVCDVSIIWERKVYMLMYLIDNWTTIRPLILNNIASNLKVWAQG